MAATDTVTLALNGGAGAMVAGFIYLIWTGRVVPRSIMDRIIDAYQGRIDDADRRAVFWKEAHDSVKQAYDDLAAQSRQSLGIGAATQQLIQTVTTAAAAANTHPSQLAPAPTGEGHAGVVA